MVFLNPTILFGLLAASIPVILHFLNLRKIKKIEFSTLAFLKELQKTKIKKIKFKQWLLLLLRILIILFLVSSFARPTLESVTISGTGSVAKTTAVFILDDSFSMSVVDENGSYFNQAKQVIADLASDFNDGDEVILVLTSNPEHSIRLGNINSTGQEIRKINISYITNSLTASIEKASALISKSINFNKEVYILSDFQESTLLNRNEDKKNQKLLFDESTKLYLFRFGGKDVNNLTVNDLVSTNQIFELKKEIGFTASVTNFSRNTISDAVLSIFLNGEINAHRNFSVKSGATKLLTFKTTLKEKGLIELIAELEDDEIEQDNTYYNIINVPEEIRVLIISDSKADSKYIKLALSTSSEKVFKIDEINGSRINSTALNNYDCVFLIGVENSIETTRLARFVKEGGRMIIMPGSKSNGETLNQVLKSLSIPIFKGKMTMTQANQFNSFEKINFKHPIFQGLFEDNSKQQIESPQITSYLKNSTSGKGESIIPLLDGSSFLSEYKFKDGRVFLFNVAPVLSWSDFPLKSIFAPIVNRSVHYLTSNRSSAKRYLAGEDIEVDGSRFRLPQVKVIRPDKSEEFINLNTNMKSNFWKYKNSDLIGVYKFYSEDKLIDAAAVNVNLEESNLKQISSDDFESLIKQNGFTGVMLNMNNKNYKEEITQARYGSELWKLFLIIALILALIEMYVAKSAKNELAELNS